MLELYHNINSVCAQKVRIALEKKGQKANDHIMTLRGDQFDPAYRQLNPNAVVPTLIHNGEPIIESSLILYYLDEVFPEPPLTPKAPLERSLLAIVLPSGPSFIATTVASIRPSGCFLMLIWQSGFPAKRLNPRN